MLTILELQPSETKLNFSASEAVGRASPLLFSGMVHILLFTNINFYHQKKKKKSTTVTTLLVAKAIRSTVDIDTQ